MNWDLQLPKQFSQMSQGYRKGRNPYEGFIRSWGIHSEKVEKLCDDDPVFMAAATSAWRRTIVSKNNIMNLYMLLRFFIGSRPFGHIVEFGSFRGGSAIFLAHVAKNSLANVSVYGFDTFEGMPPVDTDIDAIYEGEFQNTDLDELREYVASEELTNLEFIKGKFEDTADKALKDIGSVSLVHIDCDISTSVVSCYEAVKPYLVDGAYIVFDDPLAPNCLGAFEAVEEHLIKKDGLNAEQVYPHMVFRYPADFSG